MSDNYHKLYEDFLWALKKSCLKYGDFKLSSGEKTEWLLDCKKITLNSNYFEMMGDLFRGFIELDCYIFFSRQKLNGIVGVSMGGMPIAMSACDAFKGYGIDLVIVRNQRKEHGSKSVIESSDRFMTSNGKRVVVIEDVITTGKSVIETVKILEEEGCQASEVFCILDRSYERKKEIEEKIGCKINSLYLPEHFGK